MNHNVIKQILFADGKMIYVKKEHVQIKNIHIYLQHKFVFHFIVF